MTGTEALPESEHPVRAAQRRIADAFALTESGMSNGVAPSLQTIVAPLLETLGWRGSTRQISEAMPHNTPVEHESVLRAVLQRLGVETPAESIAPRRIRAAHLPCLVIEGSASVVLVTTVEADGRLRTYDPATGVWAMSSAKALRGRVHIARLVDSAQRHELLQRDGFVWPVLRSFRSRLGACRPIGAA